MAEEERKEEMDEELLVRRRKTFDDIYDKIGHIGCYQVSIYVFGTLIELTLALHVCMFYYVFESANPGWSCIPVYTNIDGIEVIGDETTKFCPSAKTRCENLTFSDEFTSISTEWGFICEKSYMSRIIQSTFFGGVLVGAFFGGFLSDTFGRKKTVMCIWTAIMILQTSSGFSPSWMVYLAIRSAVGLCAGGLVATTMVIPTEYLGPKYRVLSASRIGWPIGGLLLALTGYLIRDWHWHASTSGMIMLPALPVIAVLMPESARWLVKKRRFREAAYWLNRIARNNGKIKVNIELLEDIADDEALNGKKGEGSYIDLFRNKEYSLMSITIIWIWFTISFISYGINSNMGQLSGSIYLNFAISKAVCFISRLAVVYVASKIGRKGGFYFHQAICLVCLVVVAGFIISGKKEQYDDVITGLVLLSHTGTGGVWGLVALIPMEVYPTMIRARSFALGNTSARVGGILAPYVGLLFTINASIPYLLYLTLGVIACLLVKFFIPETKGRPLPESLPRRTIKCPCSSITNEEEEEGAHDMESVC